MDAGRRNVGREAEPFPFVFNERTWTTLKSVAFLFLETILRLPGLILLELWWRNRELRLEDITEDMLKKAPFVSYLDMINILEFVHRRNFDQSAALILSNTVLLMSALFLTLPLARLGRLYLHALSLLLFAFAHYMSSTYVSLEQTSKDKSVELDNLVSLERHGFHILAQLMLSIVQSFILGLESDFGRVFLTVFTLPILARMCGCPQDKLILAHNVACSLAMLFMCFYVLNRVPSMLGELRRGYRQFKSILVVRGLIGGIFTIWKKLRITQLLTCSWLTLFCSRLYIEMWEKGRSWREAGPALLEGVAESTSTPLSLLALALTVSYACKLIVTGAQMAVGGTGDHGHILAHSGYTEGLVLVLLCAQTGLLGMRTERKAFLLGLVLFIVMSALLQTLFELLEPQLLSLAACPRASRGRHIRCLVLSVFLFFSPLAMAYAIALFLPIDLWCVIIVSNCLLTSLHSFSTTIIYAIGVIETRAIEPWERSDDLVFYCKTVTKIIELILAVLVVIYGLYSIVSGSWTVASIAVLIVHIFVNVYRRFESLCATLTARSAARRNIAKLPKASRELLNDRKDVCAICFTEMQEEARVTPCNHLFHGACLRKWLSVKLVCPLCYAEMCEGEDGRVVSLAAREEREDMEDWRQPEAQAFEPLRPIDDLRGWPRADDDSSEYESDSSSHTEYTLASSDE